MTLTLATQRLLAGLDHGPAPQLTADGLVDLVEASGLTGRGGAGFPTARKIRSIGRGPVVVGNAMESEFLSHKDALLLRSAPGLVLDGLEILAVALRARRTLLAVGHRIDPGPVREQVAIRRSPVEVRHLDGGFVAGQESALVNRLDGRPGLPGDPLVPVRKRGVDGRPTLVVNAETLAQLALLARYGADWFRSVGTPEDPGTFLVSLTGSSREVVPRPGVVEVARGTPLRDVLASAGTPLPRARAVLLGGYHGTWLPLAALDAPLSREGLAPHGATPGAGVVHVLDRRACPLRTSADVASYLARESAGQCGPCVNGLPRMADTLARLAVPGADPRLAAEVQRLQALARGRGACAHPDGTAHFVASTMRVFAGHVEAHLRGECHALGRAA
jgi:NADH:ubiquinone oxidoreductase subunit F (NADH-binding)